MSATAQEADVQQRVTTILAGLDETLAVDATIGRASPYEVIDHHSLPLLSLDEGGHGSSVTGPRATGEADLQLVGVLGKGGMGVVYAARQRALDRDVAIKRPHSSDTADRARESLLGEARVMGALEHPNIVPVHALGRDREGLPLLVMKRVDGAAWRDLLEQPEHPMWSALGASHERGLTFHLHVLMSVCNALRFAHDRGVIHRDVKPENVMIGAFGEVYLLDWGLACPVSTLTDTRVVGTPAYMAPEMVMDPSSADERTDVYLLGSVLHQVLTGKMLHQGRSLNEVLCAVMLARPRSVSEYSDGVPTDLAELCVTATHPDRSQRPATVQAFREALAAHGAHHASQTIALSAIAKLDDVEGRLSGTPVALTDPEVGALLATARFGLEQSLQQWPENGVARRELNRCLERSCERELALRNAAAVRALLAAMSEPSPTLTGRAEQLERDLDAARALEDANQLRAREMDAKVSAVPRMLFLAAFMLVGTGASLGAYLEEQRTGQEMSMAEQAQLDLTILTFLTVGLLVMRRRLLANAFNRMTWGLWYVGTVAVTLGDLYLGHVGVGSQAATPIGFGIIALVFAVGAVMALRPLAPVALTLGTAAVLAGVFPPQATPIATIGLFISIAVNMEVSRRAAAR